MRKSDKQAIILALALFERECNNSDRCKDCNLYKDNWCLLDKPPSKLNATAIIKAMEKGESWKEHYK